jgi:hypothetical protein
MEELSGSTDRSSNAVAPICDKCRAGLGYVGRLPAIRLFPLREVYKCAPCNHVVTMRA